MPHIITRIINFFPVIRKVYYNSIIILEIF